MTKIIIIGAVAAGSKAAAKIQRTCKNAEIEVFTDDTHISYSACGLPFYVEGNFDDINKLIIRTPEQFEEVGIKVHLRHKAVKIIPDDKQIIVHNMDTGDDIPVKYDKLVIATGASPIVPRITNVNLKNVFTLRRIEDGIAIKDKMLKSKHATIVGGGYIGIELLEAFVRQGLIVTLVEFLPTIMPVFDEDISILIKQHLQNTHGDKFGIINNDLVTEFTPDESGAVKTVKTKNGLEFSTDMVVICAGVYPNVSIAKDAGIKLGASGAISVNEKMETNIADIYACGDCVEKKLIISGNYGWVPLGSTANKEGRTAALNVCGIDDEFNGILQSAVTRCFSLTMATTGLSVKQAKEFGYDPDFVLVTKKDKAGYMPDVKNITIKLVADKNSHRLLGCQGIGFGDVDKRVNTISTGLLGHLTVEEFFGDDITYAPPYSPSIDPLLTAAQLLIKKLPPKAEPIS